MKNLVIAIIVILLIIVGVVYFVGRESGDMMEEVEMDPFTENEFTTEDDPFMFDDFDLIEMDIEEVEDDVMEVEMVQ